MLRANKYINTDPESHAIVRLSRMAGALMLPLILLSNRDNEINKKRFMESVKWINDYRTWNKYWKELVAKEVLVYLDKKTLMLSPHECYGDGASLTTLIHKWNEACNASIS